MRSIKNKVIKNDATTEKKQGKASGMKKKSLVKKIFLILCSLFLATVVVIGVYSAIIISQAPKINPDNIYDILSQSTVIYDDEGNEIAHVYEEESRTNVSYEDLPENLKNSFVALEDKTFWEHNGFNFIRMAGAVKDSLFSDTRVGGTSTITQQLARNLYLKESKSERSFKRKIIEAYYTVILEKNLSKEEILTAYLNTIYLGNGASGVQSASQAYFSKDVQDLTLVESAALATIPQSPSTYALVQLVDTASVEVNTEDILKETPAGVYVLNDTTKGRRETCLKFMLDQKYISKEEYEEAVNTPLKDFINPSYANEGNFGTYFKDYVIEDVIHDIMEKEGIEYGEAWEKVYHGGLKIYSTMDVEAQTAIEKEFSNDANFPDAVNIPYDYEKNIVDDHGRIVLYSYDNMIDENGVFTLSADEAVKQKNGKIKIMAGNRLNLYDTTVGGQKDVSVEFKGMYKFENGQLYAISGGFINVPQGYKTKDADGNLIISKKFIKDYPNFFIFNEDGSIGIPSTSYKLQQQTIQPQAAMVIIENSTGQLKAMVGGRDTIGQKLHNRAINPRQPGSAIKPLTVYGAAIQQSVEEVNAGKKHKYVDYGIDKQGVKYWGDYLTASSPVIDEKTIIDGRVWPQNYHERYTGKQTLRTAQEQSLNTCAVKVCLQVGKEYSADMLEKFGVTTLVRDSATNDMNVAALAMGGMSIGISPLEMASAYTAFPNGGIRKDVSSYSKVIDKNGKEILSSGDSKEHKVLDPGAAFIMTDMLKTVVSHGITPEAATYGVAAGGKSGTTSNKYDSWFVGFTPTYTAAMWMGNDVNLQMSGYGNRSVEIWGKIMNQIPKALRGTYPSQPSNVVRVGGEYYISGTEKGLGKYEQKLKTVRICEDSGLLSTPDCVNILETEYDEEDEEAVAKIPKFYCNLHNPDIVQFPIDPTMELKAPKKEPKPEEDDDSDRNQNNQGTNP